MIMTPDTNQRIRMKADDAKTGVGQTRPRRPKNAFGTGGTRNPMHGQSDALSAITIEGRMGRSNPAFCQRADAQAARLTYFR